MPFDSGDALATILPPELHDLLRGRALTLSRPVWGQRGGRHPAARAGLGHLFRAHRPYVAGDDPRQLDWRAMARRDRPMIRQTESEDELSLVALIDLSGAMDYGEGASHKHRCSAALIAALAHLALRQGDRFGFATGGDGALDPRLVRPASGAQRLTALAKALSRPPAGVCPWRELVASAAVRLPKRSLVIAASDFLDPCPRPSARADDHDRRDDADVDGATRDDDDPIAAADRAEAELWGSFAGLRARGHDVVLLQILHADELDPPWTRQDFLRIVDPKGSRDALLGTAGALLRRYRARFAAHQRALTRHCESHGIHLLRIRSDAKLEEALLEILARLGGAMPAQGEHTRAPAKGRR